jgi:hypothetical protein
LDCFVCTNIVQTKAIVAWIDIIATTPAPWANGCSQFPSMALAGGQGERWAQGLQHIAATEGEPLAFPDIRRKLAARQGRPP